MNIENIEQFFLLIIGCQGLLLSFVLIGSVVYGRYSNFFLGLISFVISLEIMNAFAMTINYHNSSEVFPFWILGSYLIIPVSLWLFNLNNTQPIKGFKRIYLLLFIPALIEISFEFYIFYNAHFFSTNYELTQNLYWHVFTEILPIVVMLVVLVLNYRDLKSLKKRFSKSPKFKLSIHLFKLYSILIAFTLFTALWIIQSILEIQVFWIIEILISIFIFILSYIGFFQPSFFEIPEMILKGKGSNQDYNDNNDIIELKKLSSLFEKDNIYSRERLSIKEVAFMMNVPTRYLSKLINYHHNCSFIDYVNSFRVKHFLNLTKDVNQKNKTLLALGFESGFNSKSSFNESIKKFTGKKPSDFLEK